MMRYSHLYSIVTLILFTLLVSCKDDSKSKTTPSPKKAVTIPAFNADNAYANIEKQLSFGYRIPGTDAHRHCGDWIIEKLVNTGAKVQVQPFKADFLGKEDVPSFNIIAQFNPDHKQRILLGAHWDSRLIAEKDDERQDEPIKGADDGGSGVGVLLEIARLIYENPIDLGVDIVLFDAEDQGDNTSDDTWCLGSQYWSKNLMPRGYKAEYGILLDMVGSKDAVFGLEGVSYKNARKYQKRVWTLARRMGYTDFFKNKETGGVNDDHYWVMKNAKIPMIDIINQAGPNGTRFGDYHHTHDDNMDIISKRTLRVVGQVVTAVLYNESAGIL